jgi:hypothetical protein
MFQQYLLRIEAVNLEQVMEDTNQLSVIRGGSFMAREGPQRFATATPSDFSWTWLPRLLWKAGAPERISAGASVGLYQLNAPPWLAKRLVNQVIAELNKEYPYLTFAVDIEKLIGENGFQRAHEAVVARNRFRQLQQFSPAASLQESPRGPCEWDDLRPATEILTRDNRDHYVSASVKQRFGHGSRDGKKNFLLKESGIPDLDFADSFEEIAEHFHDRRLKNKLAVIYFDGNKFGKKQSACRSADKLRKFDETIRDGRKAFLKKFFNDIRTDEDFKTKDKDGN